MNRRTTFLSTFAAVAAVTLAVSPAAVLANPQGGPGLGESVSQLFKKAQAGGKLMTVWSKLQAGDVTMVRELKAMADAGDHHAHLFYGYLLDNGIHMPVDSAAAARHFRVAAETIPLARYNLGLLTLLGRGTAKNEALALRLFDETLKEQGVEQAAVRLAQHHMKAKNLKEAKRYAEIGANYSNRFCHLFLAQIYYHEKDYRSAYHWAQKAQSGGVADAGLLLANLYGHGLISQPSPAVALSWDLVYRSSRSNWATPISMPPGSWATGLSASEIDRARAMANDWVIRFSGWKDPTPYSKTIAEIRTWRAN